MSGSRIPPTQLVDGSYVTSAGSFLARLTVEAEYERIHRLRRWDLNASTAVLV